MPAAYHNSHGHAKCKNTSAEVTQDSDFSAKETVFHVFHKDRPAMPCDFMALRYHDLLMLLCSFGRVTRCIGATYAVAG